MSRKKPCKIKPIPNGIRRGFILAKQSSKKCSNCGEDTTKVFCADCGMAREEYAYTSVPILFARRISQKNKKQEEIIEELISFSNRNDYRVDFLILKISVVTNNVIVLTLEELMRLNKEIDAWNSRNNNKHLTFLV